MFLITKRASIQALLILELKHVQSYYMCAYRNVYKHKDVKDSFTKKENLECSAFGLIHILTKLLLKAIRL